LEESQLGRDFFYKVNNARGEGMALLQAAGIIGLSPKRLNEALTVAEQAQDIFKKAEDRGAQSFGLLVTAELHRAADDHKTALQHANARRKLVQEMGYTREEAKALHGIASLHLAARDPAEASRAAREGLRHARVAGDRVTEAHMLIQVAQANAALVSDGALQDRQHQIIEEAVKVSREAVGLSRKVAGGKIRPLALFWNAYALNISPHAAQALEVVEEALRLFRAARDRTGEAHATLLTAQVYYRKEKGEKAKQFADSALAMFQDLGEPRGEELATEFLQYLAPSSGRVQHQQQEQQQQQQQQLEMPSVAAVAVEQVQKGIDPVVARTQVMKIASEAIGEDEGIEFDSPLMDMGLDSLSSVSLRNDLAKEFSMSLAASVMFDYPSVGALADHIVEKSLG